MAEVVSKPEALTSMPVIFFAVVVIALALIFAVAGCAHNNNVSRLRGRGGHNRSPS